MTEQQLHALRLMADPASYRGALCYADCAAIQAALDEIDRLTRERDAILRAAVSEGVAWKWEDGEHVKRPAYFTADCVSHDTREQAERAVLERAGIPAKGDIR